MPIPTTRSFGARQIMNGLSVVPNSLTVLTAEDSVVFQIVVSNNTGTAANLTVTDGNGLYICDAYPIPIQSPVVLSFPEGVFMDGGVKWLSGTANALQGEIFGFEKE